MDNNEVYWIRLGDSGDYEVFDTVEEAAEQYVIECIPENLDLRWRTSGFEDDHFQGDDYVSLFVGDSICRPDKTRDLSDEEKELFECHACDYSEDVISEGMCDIGEA